MVASLPGPASRHSNHSPNRNFTVTPSVSHFLHRPKRDRRLPRSPGSSSLSKRRGEAIRSRWIFDIAQKEYPLQRTVRCDTWSFDLRSYYVIRYWWLVKCVRFAPKNPERQDPYVKIMHCAPLVWTPRGLHSRVFWYQAVFRR